MTASRKSKSCANYTMKKVAADHGKFLNRITKTLYYGKLPNTDRFSIPMSELAVEMFSEAHRGHTLQRLQMNSACNISRNACVNPCALVLAMLYLDRLRDCNPEYVRQVAPSELFLVSLMVSSKFLHDDGAEDEVFLHEWAVSGGITVAALKQLEKDFLNAMDWKIFISDSKFWSEFEHLEQILALREANKRGWFTYSELSLLLPSSDLAKLILCATGILTVSYIASLIVMFGAVFITSQIPGNAIKTYSESQDKSWSNETFNQDMELDSKLDIDVNDLLDFNYTSELQLDKDYFPDDVNRSAIDSILLEYKNLTKCFDREKQDYRHFVRTATWYSIIF
ncbi:protein CNPPD1-like [Ctenocephalides felis]|uniref:protein CNPPD1-like n=1 Tax=Ctenocephalides felis TaxID=7515 RepID=UPI000E6E3EC8|nr:protein CNPPD1-like [Ctenocephalides felis]